MARIDDIKRQNPQLDVSLIDIIATLDPTSTYKYLGFMVKLMKNEIGSRDPLKIFANLLFDDKYVVELKQFEEHCKANRIENPDISSYKSLVDIISANKKANQILKQKEAEKQIIRLYETNEYSVVIPLTFEASKTYGANTKWCVTMDTHWSSYQWKYRLIYVIDKINKKKYAISRKYDDQTKIQGWLEDDKEISPVLIPMSPEVSAIVFTELQKDQFVPEMCAIGSKYIMVNDGSMVTIERADKQQIKEFFNRFGKLVSPTSALKANITRRLADLGSSSTEIDNVTKNSGEIHNMTRDKITKLQQFIEQQVASKRGM